MLGIAIHCIQHSQAMLERGVCELAHSFFHIVCLHVYLILFLRYTQLFGSPDGTESRGEI